MPMASSTVAGHVSRAIDFYNTLDLYFCIGKTTSWTSDSTPTSDILTSDDNPPEPTSTDTMMEVIGYKKIESIFLVYPNDKGEISCAGRKWKIVPNTNDAYSVGARWVYLSSWLKYDELPTENSYRQVGIYSGLKKSKLVSAGKVALFPADVADPGILQALYHRKPVYRDINQRELLTTILTF